MKQMARLWLWILAACLWGWQATAWAAQTNTVTFATIATQTYGAAPFTVSATASSNGTVTITSTSTTICTVSTSGSTTTLTIVTAGTCKLSGSVPASSGYNSGTGTTSFTINKANQTITFNPLPAQTYGAAAFTVSASASSGLAVTFTSSTTAVCKVSGTNGTTVTMIAAGTCTIAANQAGNTSYNAASQVTQSFNVAPASQAITFNSLPSRTDAARPFTIAATASSGLTVTFTSMTTSYCTVSGSTVTVLADGTCTIAANQTGNANYTAAAEVQQSFNIGPFCVPPPNIPSGVSVTCVCDTFNRANINPSPMFGGTSWAVSNSDNLGNPYINSSTGLLRLTENTNYNAKAATAPGIYPAAGNYISVEFNHYAYNGSGADGVAVTLSDSSIPAVPGGYGGSQGYAPESTVGFAGGWLGVALDEYGNYSNPTEGRNGGTGATAEEVGMRGPGKGTSGYNWITGTASKPGGLSIDNHTATTPSTGYMYQVVVDARNETSGTIGVAVNRDSTTFDGNNYSSIIAPYNVYPTASTAQSSGWISQVVPNYWQISFTSSTGGSTNIHEIGDMRICAQTVYPPSGGQASGFSAIDSAYPNASGQSYPAYQNFQNGHIYMKLQNTAFKLWVAALSSTGISTAYSATTIKYVQLNLVQNPWIPSQNRYACGTNAARICDSTCTGQSAVTGGSQILAYGLTSNGAVQSANITLPTAYKELVAIMKECSNSTCSSYTSTTPACSVDSFSVRPLSVSTVTSTATNTAATGNPAFAAGSGAFTLTATTTGVAGSPSGYTGTLRVNSSAVQEVLDAADAGSWTPVNGAVASSPATTAVTFPAATSNAGSATSVGPFTYSEVGSFYLKGYNPASDTTSVRGVYDGVTSATDCPNAAQCDALKANTWSGVDSLSTANDCINDSYSNTISTDSNTLGKYGCNFGNIANTATMGRFTPDHYVLVTDQSSVLKPRSDLASCSASSFTYMGEPFGINFNLNAVDANGDVTKNYQGNYVKFDMTTPTDKTIPWLSTSPGSTGTMKLAMTQAVYPVGVGNCAVYFNGTGATSYSCTGVSNPPAATQNAGSAPRVTVLTSPANASASTTAANPTMSWLAGVGTLTANVALQRTSTGPDGPFSTLAVGLKPTDTDNVTTTMVTNTVGTTTSTNPLNLVTNNDATPPTADRASLGFTIPVEFGRMTLQSAYGSPALSLPVQMVVQYWNGYGFVTNLQDSCTTLAGANISMAFQGTSLKACMTSVPALTTVSKGQATITLPAPGQIGSIDLKALLSSTASNNVAGTTCIGSSTTTAPTTVGNAAYLLGNWVSPTTTYASDPTARVTFGVFAGNPAVIYIRESY